MSVAVDDAGRRRRRGRRAGVGGARAERAAASPVEGGGRPGRRRPGADLDADSGLQHASWCRSSRRATCSPTRSGPPRPSLESFWVVITQGYWYLEHFWHQFANSVYIGVGTVFFTLAIGSLASFAIGRMRIRYGWLLSNAALLTYVIPASFLAIPVLPDHADLRPDQQSVVGDRRRGHLRDAVRDLHLPAVRHEHPDRARRGGADRRGVALPDLLEASTCR